MGGRPELGQGLEFYSRGQQEELYAGVLFYPWFWLTSHLWGSLSTEIGSAIGPELWHPQSAREALGPAHVSLVGRATVLVRS